MTLEYFSDSVLSTQAEELVHFDVDSVRQVVAGRHGHEPEIWLVDPDAYEKNGRLLRDSTSSRLLAYSKQDQVLYATDGCNCCTRRVPLPLETLTSSELQTFAEDNDLRLDLLKRLIQVA